jgi:hypothetical protein
VESSRGGRREAPFTVPSEALYNLARRGRYSHHDAHDPSHRVTGDVAELEHEPAAGEPLGDPAPSPDWPGLTLSEGIVLDRLGGAGVRALSHEDLHELEALVVKALFEPPAARTYQRDTAPWRPRGLVERPGLTLDQRIWLRGLRQAAPAERTRLHEKYEAMRPPRLVPVDDRGRPVYAHNRAAVVRWVGLKLKREADARRRSCAMTPEQRLARSQRIKRDRLILRARLRRPLPVRFRLRKRGRARRDRGATLRRSPAHSPGRPARPSDDPHHVAGRRRAGAVA